MDVQKQKEQVNVVKKKGNKFADLNFQKKKIKESLANPEAKFRRDKDKFSRLRIRLNERAKKKSKSKKPQSRRSKLNRRIFQKIRF